MGTLRETAEVHYRQNASDEQAARATAAYAAYNSMFGEIEEPQEVEGSLLYLAGGLVLEHDATRKAFRVVRHCPTCGATEYGGIWVRNVPQLGQALAELDARPHACAPTWQEALVWALRAGLNEIKGA
jgi:hypothetical protein